RNHSGQGELAFLGDALEGFARALDPVLAIVPFGRQLTDNLVGAGGGRTRHIACSEIDSRPNRELVLQRPLHTQDFPAFFALGPRSDGGLRTLRQPSTAAVQIASIIETWQMRGFGWFFSTLPGHLKAFLKAFG